MTRRLALIVWCAFLATTLWVLTMLGTGDLATPPAPWRWGPWLHEVEPAAGVVALVRVVAVVAAWYLVLVTVVGAVGRRTRSDAMVAATDRVTPVFVRAVLGSAGGLTMSAVGLTVAVGPLVAPADLAEIPPAVADTTPQQQNIVALARAQIGTDGKAGRATLRRVNPAIDPVAPTGEGTAALGRYVFDPAPGFAAGRADRPEAHSPEAPIADVWTVRAGDHFWHMAEDTLQAAWGRTPDEAEIASYWRVVVDHNRAGLVAETNPDLIYPGQVFELPPPPSDPSL